MKFTMVNSDQFSARLQQILEYYDISAAAFADAIEVGRSSISHILSGRNKPSLDFVLKIVQAFPEVELYWLLNGKGKFPSVPGGNEVIKSEPENTSVSAGIKGEQQAKNHPDALEEQPIAPLQRSAGKTIRRIVIFYGDGTFEAFEN